MAQEKINAVTGMSTQVGATWKNVAYSLLRCDYSVTVALHVVTLPVRVRPPLVTPKKINANLADVVIAEV